MNQDRVQHLVEGIVGLARQLMAEVLIRDAELQERGDIAALGQDFDALDAAVPRGSRELGIAWTFYDAWIDECNHGFPGFHKGIERDDWPRHARHIASGLTDNSQITDPVVLSHFDLSQRRSLLTRLGEVLRRAVRPANTR